jgi:hypothetical protein
MRMMKLRVMVVERAISEQHVSLVAKDSEPD